MSLPEIAVETYNGTTWENLTPHVIYVDSNETGVTRISNCTINFEGLRSDLDSLVSNPYRLLRFKFKDPNNNWHTPFFGYINQPHLKTTAGTIEARVKGSLDCLNFSALLDADYCTFDYWKLQSAINPQTSSDVAWTYRKMLGDILLYPDSRRLGANPDPDMTAIDFTIEADIDADGLDHVIDSSCTWSQQTIFDVFRTVFDRVGYDGYYTCASESATPKVKVAKFDKAISAVFTAPYLGEPEYVGGALDTVRNRIYVWGGVDSGVPSDGDRWTEYAANKYTPHIWYGETGPTTDGTVTPYDVSNETIFTQNIAYKTGAKCLYFDHTDYNGHASGLTTVVSSVAKLALLFTETQIIDASNRFTSVSFFLKVEGGGESATHTKIGYLHLVDVDNNEIVYGQIFYIAQPHGINDFVKEYLIQVPLNEDINGNYTVNPNNNWVYYNGSTTFDWSNILALKVRIDTYFASNKPAQLKFYIDGLQFVGGLAIEPFKPYSAELNPPHYDSASKATHGLYVMHHQNSAISSFEQAYAEGERLLTNLKNPIPTLSFCKVPTQLLWPGQVVSVDGSLQRLKSINYQWMNSDKKLRAKYQSVPRLSQLPPIWTEENMQKYLIK
jgi:hypothetical protein